MIPAVPGSTVLLCACIAFHQGSSHICSYVPQALTNQTNLQRADNATDAQFISTAHAKPNDDAAARVNGYPRLSSRPWRTDDGTRPRQGKTRPAIKYYLPLLVLKMPDSENAHSNFPGCASGQLHERGSCKKQVWNVQGSWR